MGRTVLIDMNLTPLAVYENYRVGAGQIAGPFRDSIMFGAARRVAVCLKDMNTLRCDPDCVMRSYSILFLQHSRGVFVTVGQRFHRTLSIVAAGAE